MNDKKVRLAIGAGENNSPEFRIGIISDTHGLLRLQAKEFLRGCHHIVHAGDIGHSGVLEELAILAPVTAVRGNKDDGAWADRIAKTELFELQGVYLYAIHDLAELDIDPTAAGVKVVISGHSHKPLVKERDGVFFVNPGSAGPRRFSLPIAVGEVVLSGDKVSVARTVELNV